jgi:protein required for attachment to host cells
MAMNQLKIRNGDWVVVCDGRKALLTVNGGDEKYLNLKVFEEHVAPAGPTRDLGADRPGRVQQSVGSTGAVGRGGARSAVGQTDWHEQAERDFLRTVAERINRAASAGEIEGLVVVAPPKALGALKPLLSTAANAKLRGSLDKDYVKLPMDEIEKHLKG